MTGTPRKAITPAMKIQCLLLRGEILCAICGERIMSWDADAFEWDHIHALVHGGAHDYSNFRPLHYGCHKIKTKADVQAKAKGDRILGLTCNKPKKKIPSRPFQKRKAA